jgi:hypothetical protein
MHTKESLIKFRLTHKDPDTGKKYTNAKMGTALGLDGSTYSRKERGKVEFKQEEINLVAEWLLQRHPGVAISDEGGTTFKGTDDRTEEGQSMRYRLEMSLDAVRAVYQSGDTQAIDLMEWGITVLKRQLPKPESNFQKGGKATAPGDKFKLVV